MTLLIHEYSKGNCNPDQSGLQFRFMGQSTQIHKSLEILTFVKIHFQITFQLTE